MPAWRGRVCRPPEDAASRALWVHRDCLDGQAEAVCGTPRVMLWRGDAALACLVQSWMEGQCRRTR